MELDLALLCDAVTIREGLLHILGGGVTTVMRSSYPAPLNLGLAVRLLLEAAELSKSHTVEVRLSHDDDRQVGALGLVFEVAEPSPSSLGENEGAAAALPIPIMWGLPEPGEYRLELRVDDEENARATIVFRAVLT